MMRMPNDIMFKMIIICIMFCLWGWLFWREGSQFRKVYITVKYNEVQKDVYDSLKEAGINLTPEQKQSFEMAVKQNHKAVGFK